MKAKESNFLNNIAALFLNISLFVSNRGYFSPSFFYIAASLPSDLDGDRLRAKFNSDLPVAGGVVPFVLEIA